MLAVVGNWDVASLAREQAVEFERQHSMRRRARPVVLRILAVPAMLVGALFERQVDKLNHKLQQQLVFFRGARAKLEESETAESEIDADDSLRTLIESMEGHLAGMAAQAVEIAEQRFPSDDHRPKPLRDAFRKVGATSIELRSEVQHFKWAMQAHDANVCALRRARSVSRTTEELDGELVRIFS